MVNDHLAPCFPVSSPLKTACASTSERTHTYTHSSPHSHLLNCQAVISASGLATRFVLLAADHCKGNAEMDVQTTEETQLSSNTTFVVLLKN